MKLVKIKNKYMYEGDNPNGVHIYAVFQDSITKKTKAVRTTHLYESKKQKKLERGQLLVMKLPKLLHPSGITNELIETDVHGDALNLKAVKAQNIAPGKATYLSKKQSEKIKAFAKSKKRKKKKTP